MDYSWKLCDFGSSGTRFEFHRGHWLFISVSLFFSQSEDSKKFQSLSHEQQWPPHMRAKEVYKNLPAGFIGFKNLPAGYYRDLQTSGQSMCSNGRLAIDTSIKNLSTS